MTKGVGGYYELALPNYGRYYHDNTYRFQSARAALCALFLKIRPAKVWVPKYTCNVVLDALKEARVDYFLYDLDLCLRVKNHVILLDNEYFLYINYFGICTSNIEKLIESVPADKIILDCSQAFFSLPCNKFLATIYSPRKFFGVPDGGMLVTKLSIKEPEHEDNESLDRMTHLLKRLYSSPEDGYIDYQKSELSLMDCKPLKMSKLTERLLQSMNFEAIKKIRNENYLYLKKELKNYNDFILIDEIDDDSLAPLCYPLMNSRHKLKEQLIKNKIFIPTYWKDAVSRVEESWAINMIDNLLPIPIDQRYSLKDMQMIVNLIKDFCDD